jgi:hypothetical protein
MIFPKASSLLALTISISGLFAPSARAGDPYARITQTPAGIVTLEMGERIFKPIEADTPRIHLIAAIHIADQSFYKAMQARLDSYDIVLFEGVKPAGLDPIDPLLDDQAKADATADRINLLIDIAARYYDHAGKLPQSFDDLLTSTDSRIAAIVRSIETDAWGEPIKLDHYTTTTDDQPPVQHITFTSTGADFIPGGQGPNADIQHEWAPKPSESKKSAPVGIQTQLADALHVSFQLDEMDTTNPNWINADIDINELQAQLAEMGEDNAMILNLIEGDSFQAKLIGFVLKFVQRSKTMSSMMKLVMMDMLAMMETSDMLSQFEAIEQVILLGRNDTVIEYLKEALENNPDAKDIAIFYGGAHMPGIEQTILNDLGYEYESITWTPAMSVNIKDTGMTPGQIKMMRNMMKNSLEKQFE